MILVKGRCVQCTIVLYTLTFRKCIRDALGDRSPVKSINVACELNA